MDMSIEDVIKRGWGNLYVNQLNDRLEGWNKSSVDKNVIIIIPPNAGKKVYEEVYDSIQMFGFATPDYLNPEGNRIIDMFHPFRELVIHKIIPKALDDHGMKEGVSVIQFLIAWFEYDVVNRICNEIEKGSSYYSIVDGGYTGYQKIDMISIIISNMLSAMNKTNIHKNVIIDNYLGGFNENACRTFIDVISTKLNTLKIHGNKKVLNSSWNNSKILISNEKVAKFIHDIKPLVDLKTLDEVNTLLNNFGLLIRK